MPERVHSSEGLGVGLRQPLAQNVRPNHVAELSIQAKRSLVEGPYVEAKIRDVALLRPALGMTHELGTDALTPMLAGDAD